MKDSINQIQASIYERFYKSNSNLYKSKGSKSNSSLYKSKILHIKFKRVEIKDSVNQIQSCIY